MTHIILGLVVTISFLLPSVVNGEEFVRYPSNYNHIYLHDGDRGPIHHTGPLPIPDESWGSDCFPHGCGGISGPVKNPDPNARNPENLTACMYDASGTLLYERENKICSYKYIDQNQLRVERRKREWLSVQKAR